MSRPTKRLLILSCSGNKRAISKPLPAIDRYNGPLFQIVRKFDREHPNRAGRIDIFILSAKFGLISQETPIPDYDLRMTASRVEILRSKVRAKLGEIIEKSQYRDLLVVMGKSYLKVLAGLEDLLPDDIEVSICGGQYGRQQARLYDWLHGHPPRQFHFSSTEGTASIRDVEISRSPEEVIEVARDALRRGAGSPSAYQAWYVEVDGTPVAPKWLASQLTGLSVSDFNTGQARRFLSRLGMKVQRV